MSGHTACMWCAGEQASMLCFGGLGPDGRVINLLFQVALPSSAAREEAKTQKADCRATWGLADASGKAPSPRYCHSAETLSDGWMIFGGWAKGTRVSGDGASATQLNRDGSRPFLNDLHLLTLSTMSWAALETAGPRPRGRCQAVMVASRDENVLMVFGGATHHDPQPGQAYGDMVEDLSDVALLHVPTLTWLPPEGLPSYHAQRGGTNTLVRAGHRRFIFGGMNSDVGDDNPNFLNTMTWVVGLSGEGLPTAFPDAVPFTV